MGGRDHSSHRLVAIGLSERSAVLVLWSLAAIGGVIGIALRSASDGVSVAAGGAVPAGDVRCSPSTCRASTSTKTCPAAAQGDAALGRIHVQAARRRSAARLRADRVGVLRCQPVVLRSRGVPAATPRTSIARCRSWSPGSWSRSSSSGCIAVPGSTSRLKTSGRSAGACCSARLARSGADRDLSSISVTRFRSSGCMRCC